MRNLQAAEESADLYKGKYREAKRRIKKLEGDSCGVAAAEGKTDDGEEGKGCDDGYDFEGGRSVPATLSPPSSRGSKNWSSERHALVATISELRGEVDGRLQKCRQFRDLMNIVKGKNDEIKRLRRRLGTYENDAVEEDDM